MEPDQRRIEQAVATWARSVFSAPRQLPALVTNIESRDEVIVRVATSITRRELREARSPTSERRSTRPRIARSEIDPFSSTGESLKVDSEHVTQCNACTASGLVRCGSCTGSGIGHCPACRGSGKVASPKTGRPINCKSCKASGSAACRPCGGRGSVHCDACLGSGHQLAWLTLVQTQRCELVVPLQSPVVVAHPVLAKARALLPNDLLAMSVVEDQTADGPLDLQRLSEPDRRVVEAQLERVDHRLERIHHQQFLKLAVIRRDVTFEMCGTQATLSLSGASLAGATTPQVLRPIRRRLYAWTTLGVLVAVVLGWLSRSTVGSSIYFADARAATDILAAAAAVCAIPMLGTLLRSWRGGSRFHPMRWPFKAWSAGVLVALSAIIVVGMAARPAASDVTSALANHDAGRARAVLDALLEHPDAATDVADLEDQVVLGEADTHHGRERLTLLDTVAAHHGAAAARAAADARTQRLDDVRGLIASNHPTEAIAELDRSFARDKTVVVAEERAHAHETIGTACKTSACRLVEAIQASTARSTPARTAAVELVRAQVVQTLDIKRAHGPDLLTRLKQLRELEDTATEVHEVPLEDTALQELARTALTYAETERRAVPLLGQPLSIAEQLLGASRHSPTGAATFELDGVTAYLALNAAGNCIGVYAIGHAVTSRAFTSKTWPADRVLAQAIGKPSSIAAPRAREAVSRWFAGGTPVVARWEFGALVELRIGDATP
jgi:hypothetical protein